MRPTTTLAPLAGEERVSFMLIHLCAHTLTHTQLQRMTKAPPVVTQSMTPHKTQKHKHTYAHILSHTHTHALTRSLTHAAAEDDKGPPSGDAEYDPLLDDPLILNDEEEGSKDSEHAPSSHASRHGAHVHSAQGKGHAHHTHHAHSHPLHQQQQQQQQQASASGVIEDLAPLVGKPEEQGKSVRLTPGDMVSV